MQDLILRSDHRIPIWDLRSDSLLPSCRLDQLWQELITGQGMHSLHGEFNTATPPMVGRSPGNAEPVPEETRPLYRWVGGKRKILAQILPFVPKTYGTFFEPFFGGGALYFALQPKRAVLGDINPELVNFLQVVKDSPDKLTAILGLTRNTKAAYYAMRSSAPIDRVERAARFQYLVNLAFSGVYRVNKGGHYNVPYSKERNREYFDASLIKAAHELLKTAEITCGDFSETVKSAQPGDFVYFDPPYTVAHDNNGFLEYNESIFQWKDQEKLAKLAHSLAEEGVTVIVSNANHDTVRSLYDGRRIRYITRRSTVAASADYRGEVKEILVVYS